MAEVALHQLLLKARETILTAAGHVAAQARVVIANCGVLILARSCAYWLDCAFHSGA